jgi:hypothetical protein
MVSRAKVNVLRQADTVTDPDISQIVNPTALPKPAVVTYPEMPGTFDAQTRLESARPADSGSEDPQ